MANSHRVGPEFTVVDSNSGKENGKENGKTKGEENHERRKSGGRKRRKPGM
jgi:hypothetical protein